MITDQEKAALAAKGDDSLEAAQLRFSAAIDAVGMSKVEFARQIDQKVAAITNSTKGPNYPSRKAMTYLYRFHLIGPAFIMFGDWSGIPAEMLDRLVSALGTLRMSADRPLE
jgi:hypothetical protein